MELRNATHNALNISGLKLLLLLLVLVTISVNAQNGNDEVQASAASVGIDGIWYHLASKMKTAEVAKKTSGKYSGAIVIPEKVTYNGAEYRVTSIGESAFYSCTGLTSITIPNSVTSIGDAAFSY